MSDNSFIKLKNDIENIDDELHHAATAHRSLQCFFGILFTILGTIFVSLLCQPQLVDPEIVASSTIKFPMSSTSSPLNYVNNTSSINLDPSYTTMRHEQEQINQILNSPSDEPIIMTNNNNNNQYTKSSIVPTSSSSSSSSNSSINMTKTSPSSSSKKSDHIKLVRESGQYYFIIHNIKHAIAKSEFDYFNLKLDDVENLIPNSRISKSPDGESFMELPEPFRLEVKKKFKAENHYGFYTSKEPASGAKKI